MPQKRTKDRHHAGSVLVAVDESPSARETLSWAASYARVTALPLHAVHVVHPGGVGTPTSGLAGRLEFPSLGAPGAIAMSPAAVETPRTTTTDQDATPVVLSTPPMVQEAFDDVDPEPDWTLEVVEGFSVGSVGSVVLDHAGDAALVVVGTGERSAVRRLLSGSVSRYCLSHAAVPVLAVPTAHAHDAKASGLGQRRSG